MHNCLRIQKKRGEHSKDKMEDIINNKTEFPEKKNEIKISGLLCWSSGLESLLPKQGHRVPCLVEN